MTLYQHTRTGKTNGSAIAVDGSDFDAAVVAGAGATGVYETIAQAGVPSIGARITGPTGVQEIFGKNISSTFDFTWAGFVKIPATPGGNTQMFTARNAAKCGSLLVTTGLLFQGRTGNDANLLSSAYQMVINTWYKVQYTIHVDTTTSANGKTKVRISDLSGNILAEAENLAASNGTTGITSYREGKNDTTGTFDVLFAGEVSDSSYGYIEPYSGSNTLNLTWTDNMGITDLTDSQQIDTGLNFVDQMNMVDTFNLYAQPIYGFSWTEQMNMSDDFSINASNNQNISWTDVEGLTDSFSLLVGANYQPSFREFENLTDSFNLSIKEPLPVDYGTLSLEGLRQLFYISALGGAVPDDDYDDNTSLEIAYYKSILGNVKGSISDLRKQYFQDFLGYTSEFEYLGSLDYTGSLADRRYAYFSDVTIYAPSIGNIGTVNLGQFNLGG